jgi:hypothetical protein
MKLGIFKGLLVNWLPGGLPTSGASKNKQSLSMAEFELAPVNAFSEAQAS